MESSEASDAKLQVIGAPGRIRTSDLRIRSPLLYPLSYRRLEKRISRPVPDGVSHVDRGRASVRCQLAEILNEAMISWMTGRAPSGSDPLEKRIVIARFPSGAPIVMTRNRSFCPRCAMPRPPTTSDG